MRPGFASLQLESILMIEAALAARDVRVNECRLANDPGKALQLEIRTGIARSILHKIKTAQMVSIDDVEAMYRIADES